jgi:DNA-3-methyladenine glycosylase II
MVGHTDEEIARARAHLASADAALARADRVTPPFSWRVKEAGFPGLVQLVLEQQVSTASAASLWARMRAAFPQLTPGAVLAQDKAFLRSLGLSSQKTSYVRGIAEAVEAGSLDLGVLSTLADEEAAAQLMRLRGIGRWTAEAYLMGAEGRTDIFPAGDLALQEGLRWADRAEQRPGIDALYQRAEAWKPYRGVAAHLLWGYYAAVRKNLVAIDA